MFFCLGVSMNIYQNITYIIDSSGSLLSLTNDKLNILLITEKEVFMDITIDWLNNHLYILTSSMKTRNTTVYSIKKFDIEQKKIVEIISEINQQPFQIEVDPCNG